MLNPTLLIIDHGHFQYNAVMLGLTLWSIHFILEHRFVWASIFYCLAIGYKHMALYYSLAYFFFLLGFAFSRPHLKQGWVHCFS
jgi:alpha-1,3-glucosyltransferase